MVNGQCFRGITKRHEEPIRKPRISPATVYVTRDLGPFRLRLEINARTQPQRRKTRISRIITNSDQSTKHRPPSSNPRRSQRRYTEALGRSVELPPNSLKSGWVVGAWTFSVAQFLELGAWSFCPPGADENSREQEVPARPCVKTTRALTNFQRRFWRLAGRRKVASSFPAPRLESKAPLITGRKSELVDETFRLAGANAAAEIAGPAAN